LSSLFEAEGVLVAYIFGSLAQQREGNDVDLALLLPLDQPVYLLREKLSAVLGTERIDIVDLSRANNVLRFEIISTGRCLFAANDELRLDFELETVRIYHDREVPRRRQEAVLRERMAWLSNEI
ncbi:MAG: hypothetical protein KC419_04385, partial [Anaerolineales bacterium]|nr:hypothetical protein [Anaerolineales bacterium]